MEGQQDKLPTQHADALDVPSGPIAQPAAAGLAGLASALGNVAMASRVASPRPGAAGAAASAPAAPPPAHDDLSAALARTVARRKSVTDGLRADVVPPRGRPAAGNLLQRKLSGSPNVEVVGNQVKLGGSVLWTGDPVKTGDWGELTLAGTFGFNGFVDFGGTTPPGRTVQDNTAEAKQGDVKEIALKASARVFEGEGQHPVLEAIDVEPEIGAGGAPKGQQTGGSFGLAVGVKFKFSQGLEIGVKAVLTKVATPGGASAETGEKAAYTIQAPAIEGEVKREVALAKLFKGAPFGTNVKYDGLVVFSGKASLEVNKTKLATEVAKKVGPEVLSKYFSAAAEVGNVVRNILASGPAVVGILGAYITIKATLATLEQGDEERRVADAAQAATEGYVAGFMAGVGFSMSGGDPAWFADARAKGAAARGALVAWVKSDERLVGKDIGPDEVLLAIADHKDAFHSELYGRVKPQIASLYIQKWKQNLGFWERTFTNEEKSGERNIRTRMGLPDRGDLPKPQIGGPAPAS
jgi:hypothetical protein